MNVYDLSYCEEICVAESPELNYTRVFNLFVNTNIFCIEEPIFFNSWLQISFRSVFLLQQIVTIILRSFGKGKIKVYAFREGESEKKKICTRLLLNAVCRCLQISRGKNECKIGCTYMTFIGNLHSWKKRQEYCVVLNATLKMYIHSSDSLCNTCNACGNCTWSMYGIIYSSRVVIHIFFICNITVHVFI